MTWTLRMLALCHSWMLANHHLRMGPSDSHVSPGFLDKEYDRYQQLEAYLFERMGRP